MADKIEGFGWHIHHTVLVEPWVESEKARIGYIRKFKPASEIDTRIHLMKSVKGQLPSGVVEAGEELRRATTVWCKYHLRAGPYYVVCPDCDPTEAEGSHRARVAAEDNYFAALVAHADAIAALHEVECPNCPWDGKTIFPERDDG